jgi:hypothetical protein
MNQDDYLRELTVLLVKDKIHVSHNITSGLFRTMTPRALGFELDRIFDNAIRSKDLLPGKLVSWNIKPWILGFGFVTSWDRWDGFCVEGVYENLNR